MEAVAAPTIVPAPVTLVSSFNEPDPTTGVWTCVETVFKNGKGYRCGKCFPAGRQQGANVTNHMLKKHNKAKPKEEGKKRVRKRPTAAPARGCGGAAGGGAHSVETWSMSGSDDGGRASYFEQLVHERKKVKALKGRVRLLEESAAAASRAAAANLAVAVSCAKKLLGVYFVCVCVCVCVCVLYVSEMRSVCAQIWLGCRLAPPRALLPPLVRVPMASVR